MSILMIHHKSAKNTDLLHVRRVVLTRELREVNHLLVGDARRKIPGRVVREASAALCKNTHMTVQEVVRRLGTCMSLCNVIPPEVSIQCTQRARIRFKTSDVCALSSMRTGVCNRNGYAHRMRNEFEQGCILIVRKRV